MKAHDVRIGMSHLSAVQKKEFFIDFSTYFHEPFVCGKGVPKVLHIGPYNSKGGMSSVMNILHDFPPQGWTSDIISTHDERSIFHNIFRFFSSKKKCHRQFKSENRPDLVHVHCASDWSWKRKAKFIQLATRYSIPCVLHIHSGALFQWLGYNKNGVKQNKRCNKFLQIASKNLVSTVVLNEYWKERFSLLNLEIKVISNPVHPRFKINHDIEKINGKILILGRDDPVKNHDKAIEIFLALKQKMPQATLWMTGRKMSPSSDIHALGWISDEEVVYHLQTSELVLLPSIYEGQPMVALEALACGTRVLLSNNISKIPGTSRVSGNSSEDWVNSILDECAKTSQVIPPDFADIELIRTQWKLQYETQLEGL